MMKFKYVYSGIQIENTEDKLHCTTRTPRYMTSDGEKTSVAGFIEVSSLKPPKENDAPRLYYKRKV